MNKALNEKKGITWLDVRIGVSVLICCLTSVILNSLNLKISCGGRQLEIIQRLTACISCLLVCQDNVEGSKKAGLNRLIITAIGGLTGIAVVVIDDAVRVEWLLAVMVTVAVTVTLVLCKYAGVPYVNARIGGVTCVLVACTMSGPARIVYAGLRLVGTLYGALISVLVTIVFTKLTEKKYRNPAHL